MNWPRSYLALALLLAVRLAAQTPTFGTGRIEVEIPFHTPPDRPTRLLVDIGGGLLGEDVRAGKIAVCDQYAAQAEAFSRSILEGTPVPTPLEDSMANMAVIEALFCSEKSWRWEQPERYAHAEVLGSVSQLLAGGA